MPALTIAIGGVSNAGKTHLAKRLLSHFGTQRAVAVCQDDFAHPIQRIPEIADRTDWEHPDSIDHQALRQKVIDLRDKMEIVIVEGLMIYHDPATLELFDKMLFVEIDFPTFWKRRTADTRWGYEPEWYVEHVWKSYHTYGLPPEKVKPLYINGSIPIRLKQIIEFVEK
ncbi:uridine kinase [Bacteroidales bacterium]